MNQFIRTELIYGKKSIESLNSKHVCIFGIGGVGGYVTEALVRTGIGEVTLVDDDKVSLSNLNRQIVALHSTIGEYKVDVMERRIKEINPNIKVNKIKSFILPSNIDTFDFSKFDYIVDAIDTVSAKIAIIKKASELNIPMISSTGTGNKINPMGFMVSDITKTSVDPLCKVLRRELKKRGINHLKVVYSKEEPFTPLSDCNIDYSSDSLLEKGVRTGAKKRSTPGSNAFCPAAAGLLIASEVIKDLTCDSFRSEENK